MHSAVVSWPIWLPIVTHAPSDSALTFKPDFPRWRYSMMTPMRVWPFVLLLPICAACHTKDEARALVSAVDAYRSAPNDDKPAKADALDKVECTDQEVCAVKETCRKSADATARGLRLQKEVEHGARDSGPYADDLAAKWKTASSDLAEGYGYLEECRNKTQALKERFG